MLYTFDSLSPAAVATHEMTDEQLMAAIVKQDQLAFQELHARHSTMLRSTVNRVLYDDFTAEDVVQEIFVDLWTSADRYSETKGKVISWLMTIARRRAIDRLRKIQCRQRATDRLENDSEKQPQAWTHSRIESDIDAMEMKKLLAIAIDRLPEAQREALQLAYFQGLSQREIAAKTHTPLGTIKTRLDLAMRKLSGNVKAMMNDNLASVSVN